MTFPIEVSLAGLPNMIRMFSHTQFGLSFVILTFDDKANAYFVRQLKLVPGAADIVSLGGFIKQKSIPTSRSSSTTASACSSFSSRSTSRSLHVDG